MELHEHDLAAERRQCERVGRARERRDDVRAEHELAQLKRAAAGEENLMPYILDAARARATEGEIVAALQEIFGTYTDHPYY